MMSVRKGRFFCNKIQDNLFRYYLIVIGAMVCLCFYWITTINAIHHLLSFFLCVGPKRYLNMVQCNLVTHFRLSLKKLKYWRCRSNTMICNMPIYCVTSCHWWNSNFQKLVLCFILIFFWFACVNHSSNEYQVHAAEKMARQGTEHWSLERADDY